MNKRRNAWCFASITLLKSFRKAFRMNQLFLFFLSYTSRCHISHSHDSVNDIDNIPLFLKYYPFWKSNVLYAKPFNRTIFYTYILTSYIHFIPSSPHRFKIKILYKTFQWLLLPVQKKKKKIKGWIIPIKKYVILSKSFKTENAAKAADFSGNIESHFRQKIAVVLKREV